MRPAIMKLDSMCAVRLSKYGSGLMEESMGGMIGMKPAFDMISALEVLRFMCMRCRSDVSYEVLELRYDSSKM